MNRTYEDKQLRTTAIESKDDVPDAAPCPDKPMHRLKLGRTCVTCETVIPMQMAFNVGRVRALFTPPAAKSAPSAYGPDAESAALWEEYEFARAAYEDSVFAVDDLRRERSQLVGQYVGADGNVVEDFGVYARAARSDQAIAEAEARREKLRDAAQGVLLRIQKADAGRRARHLRALHLESFPERVSG